MSRKRRRRQPRNIWGAPPEPAKPFDYDDDFQTDDEVEVEVEEVAEVAEIAEEPPPETVAPEEPEHAGPKHHEVFLDDDPLPEDELFPSTSHRRAKHRKRSVVVPRKAKPGRHSIAPEEPVVEHEPVPEVHAEVIEEELAQEIEAGDEEPAADVEIDYRPRHHRRRRVLFPGRSRPGKHSVGAPAPHTPAQPEIPDLEESPPEPVETEPEYEGLQEVEPPDEPEFLEEIEPYEPRRGKRRRGRGRHREPGSPLLPRQRGTKGRHSIAPADDEEDDVPLIDDLAEESVTEVVAEEAPVATEPVFDDEPDVVLDEEPELDYDDEVEDVIVVEEELDAAEAFFEDDEIEEELAPFEPRRKRRKRSTRVRYVAGLLTALVTAAATVAVALTFDRGADPATEDGPAASGAAAAPDEVATTTLVYAVREAHEDEGPVWLTLLAYDPADEQASAIYIPAHLASEIPGHGLKSLSEGWVSGGPSLLLSSAENLLGLRIDRFVEISDNDAQVLFDATGPITVDVPSEVSVPHGASQARLIFDEGPQELSPEFLVRLLYTRGLDVDDAELGSRILAFWDALLEHYAGDRTALGTVIRGTGPALSSDAETNEIVEFFESLASVPEESVFLTSLPVHPIAAGDSELYSADLDEIQKLLQETLGEVGSTGDDVTVQILNGNGEPGVGAQVAERLIGKGFRVILSGNAMSFDYETTLIVTYDDSPEGKALAERARELLGVGEVQVSAQQQGSVDLTIVVGKDFLGAR